jgi:uncharacterized protein YjcR
MRSTERDLQSAGNTLEMDAPRLMSAAEVAEVFGINPATVRRWGQRRHPDRDPVGSTDRRFSADEVTRSARSGATDGRRETKRALRTGAPISTEDASARRQTLHDAAEQRKRCITELGTAKYAEPDGTGRQQS